MNAIWDVLFVASMFLYAYTVGTEYSWLNARDYGIGVLGGLLLYKFAAEHLKNNKAS